MLISGNFAIEERHPALVKRRSATVLLPALSMTINIKLHQPPLPLPSRLFRHRNPALLPPLARSTSEDVGDLGFGHKIVSQPLQQQLCFERDRLCSTWVGTDVLGIAFAPPR